MYAKVIVDVPVIQVNRPFDYHVPEILQESIEVGMRVAVPFGGRSISGFVLALTDDFAFNGFRPRLVTRNDSTRSIFVKKSSRVLDSMLPNNASSDVEIQL